MEIETAPVVTTPAPKHERKPWLRVSGGIIEQEMSFFNCSLLFYDTINILCLEINILFSQLQLLF